MIRIAIVFLIICLISTAHGRPRGVTAVAGCPQGLTFPDGCPGAPANGVIQHPTFFTAYANQNGQNYVTTPPWNVAGVHYGVGYPSTQSFKDPSINSLPTGCTRNAGTHVITCSGANGGLTIDGWDFGNVGGAGLCERLVISGNVNGHIIIQNSNFANNSGNGYQCNVNNGALVVMSSNSAATDVVVQDSLFDMNAQNAPYPTTNGFNPALSVSMANGQNVTIQYNGFLHNTARSAQVSSSGIVTEQFNYGEGYTYLPTVSFTGSVSGTTLTVSGSVVGIVTVGQQLAGTGIPSAGNVMIVTAFVSGTPGGTGTYTVTNAGSITIGSETITGAQPLHGEFTEDSSGGGTATVKNISYNTLLQPTNAIGLSATALVYASSGAADSTWTTFNINNNTLVSNKIGSSNPVAALAEAAYDTYTTLNWTQNYFDPNGAFACIQHASSPVIGTENFVGNIDMFDGSTVSAIGACPGHN